MKVGHFTLVSNVALKVLKRVIVKLNKQIQISF